ncbi:nucleoporin NUP116/NSP116 [Babesia caballi]|uniref:Nucleoporin NUP116/NSP116 n=1 Tax=Babesia caballi TaxID=5871 RepID=A0AAV4LNL2_BABCB|nr:nucleoporin NUP116/NSP116 [Babesia caballi]
MAVPFSFNSTAGTATGSGSSIFGASGATTFNPSGTSSFGASTAPASSGPKLFGSASAPGMTSTFDSQSKMGATGFNQSAPAVSTIPQSVNSRCTVRLLTQLVPHWRGHFDVAEILLTAHESNIGKVRSMVDRLVELDKQCWQSHDHIKNSLNGISLMQSKLEREVSERCKRQDAQNLISIKARRLSESLQPSETPRGSKVSAIFRVPNHLHVQLTKELLDVIRSWKHEIHLLQQEVSSLNDIDLSQYVSTVKVVIGSHEKRIANLGVRLTKALTGMDARVRSKELWGGVADETSELKKAFLTAVGLPVRPPINENETVTESTDDTSNEIKKQIAYLRKFNTAFRETGKFSVDVSGYNIRELLQQPTPQPTSSGLFGSMAPSGGLFGSTAPNTTGTSLFGTNTGTTGSGLFGGSGGTNLFGSTAKPAGTTGLFGATNTGTTGTTGLFGGTSTGTTGSTGLFGSTNTNTTGTTGLFGSTSTGTTGSTGLFGSTNTATTGTTGLFGSTSTGTTGSTGLFGSTNTATTGTTGLFGSTNTATSGSTGLFGSASTSTFGQTQQPTATGGLFGQQNTGTTFGQQQQPAGTTGSLFGSSTSTTAPTTFSFGQQQGTTFGQGTAFGQQPGTTFGQQQGTTFGQQQDTTFGQQGTTFGQGTAFGQQGTSGGLFGNSGTQQPSSTNVFGQQTTEGLFGQTGSGNTAGQQSTGSKSTAIVPYTPNPLLR